MRNLMLVLAAILTFSPLLLWAGTQASRDAPDWFDRPYAYALIDQDVRGALGELGHHLGLMVVLSEKVRGKARSTLRSRTAGDFITQLCETNGLGWYFDGSVLYVNTDDEVATRLFRRGPGLDPERLRDYLAGLDVHGRQLAVRASEGGDEVLVSGPPAYLERVQQHVDSQPRPAAPVALNRSVRVFRGATVSDH
ncbi:type III secretion protein [Pseudomonas sp. X10]